MRSDCLTLAYSNDTTPPRSVTKEIAYVDFADVQTAASTMSEPARIIVPRRAIGRRISVRTADRSIRLETLLVEQLAGMRRDAEKACDQSIRAAAIAVPPCYFDSQRAALREIGLQSAIDEVTLVSEPIALIRFLQDQGDNPEGHILVVCFDVGLCYISLLSC